jgi:hypothetical protein
MVTAVVVALTRHKGDYRPWVAHMVQDTMYAPPAKLG